jgi:hypothetical protein
MTGDPRVQMPSKEMTLSLRELMRGAFQGAARGATDAVRDSVHGGLLYLAPSLAE